MQDKAEELLEGYSDIMTGDYQNRMAAKMVRFRTVAYGPLAVFTFVEYRSSSMDRQLLWPSVLMPEIVGIPRSVCENICLHRLPLQSLLCALPRTLCRHTAF